MKSLIGGFFLKDDTSNYKSPEFKQDTIKLFEEGGN
jgi:hypothetical protein